ncbi:MAG: PDDEXK nuclease domain-containing protein [Kiritimatiellae bacterium]|nr:PDDEXK nuclease domain-containing protein [Kiritimatiellia bacterium]MDD4025347.1 PDDEXK nuclease domain-containing protein [Kiritimatiellia bacterium]
MKDVAKKSSFIIKTTKELLRDIRVLIQEARSRVAVKVNQETTLLYWNIGRRINEDVLSGKRAEYGRQIVSTVSAQLQQEFGSHGFDEKSIRRMMQFAATFTDSDIVATLSRQLSWSHFVEVLPLSDEVKRDFYLTMAMHEGWGIRTLREKIGGMLYERSLISDKPEGIIRSALSDIRTKGTISPDVVFKSPYFLDFTGLHGVYSEASLEDRLILHLEQFIMELGAGFSFVARQKRMIVDGEDFYLDLLFYHRKLRRLIAIDLKLGRFKAAYKGQMELYLRWLEKHEMQAGEESPLGLILCAEGGREQIELLQLDKAGIRVAQYLTELPDKKLLKRELRLSLEHAREYPGES